MNYFQEVIITSSMSY